MTPDEQLDKWVNGFPEHNQEEGECCPDFSCCCPDALQPKEVREAFRDANDEERTKFLAMFLGVMIEKYYTKKVHIINEHEPND